MLLKVRKTDTNKSISLIFVGAVLLIVAADLIVNVATQTAILLNVPLLLIGMFVVAIGTSLPELVLEITAIRREESSMAFGNILGSVVTNSTLILGVTVMLSEIQLEQGMMGYLLATVAFIGAFFLFWLFVWTKQTLERWEGAVLVMFYLGFVMMEVGGVSERLSELWR
jgi:cation:H+ antiporter